MALLKNLILYCSSGTTIAHNQNYELCPGKMIGIRHKTLGIRVEIIRVHQIPYTCGPVLYHTNYDVLHTILPHT